MLLGQAIPNYLIVSVAEADMNKRPYLQELLLTKLLKIKLHKTWTKFSFFHVFSHTTKNPNQTKPKKKTNKKHPWMLCSSHGTVLEKTGIKSAIWFRSLKINIFLNNSHCYYRAIYFVIRDWYVMREKSLCKVNYFKPDTPVVGSFVLLKGVSN